MATIALRVIDEDAVPTVQKGMNAHLRIRRTRLLPIFLLAAGACSVTLAGTVEVVVHDQNGAPLINERVIVHPPSAQGQIQSPFGHAEAWMANTNSDGIARFDDLPPGPYTATMRPSMLGLVPPEENPLAPVPTVTLESEQDRARLEIELWHGTPVVARVVVLRGEIQWARIAIQEVDHKLSLDHSLLVNTDEERILAPGRWELTFDPPPGYLLLNLEIDGRPVEGHVASIELASFGSPSFVTWQITAPSAISGNVYFEGEPAAVSVVARLVEPGPWIEAVRRRGGSRYEAVEAMPDKRGEYLLELPDGRWELTVVGNGVVSVDPERSDLVVPPGAQLRQDFKVETEKEEKDGMILVSVEDPDGNDVIGATVEVWPADVEQRGDEPITRERTESFGALVRGLPAGSYVIAAGHPRFVEGRYLLPEFDPDEKKSVRPVVVLKRAGTLHAVARNSADEAVESVPLVLTRIDQMPAMFITEERLVAAVSETWGETDATGHAWIEGIWPGTYELRGDLNERGRSSSFVRFMDGDRLREAIDVTFTGGEEQQVEVEILPASSFSARLVCTDEYSLPGSVSVAALPAGINTDALDGSGWLKYAELRVDDIPLAGTPRERLLAGPLQDDVYYLAVQPKGHQRWTWAMGTERLSDAAVLTAVPDDTTELGTLELHCGPAIRVTPRVGDGRELPDLESVTPGRGRLAVSGTVTKNGEIRPLERIEVDAYPDELIIRGLPEGAADLNVSLSHPYFLPPVINVPIRAELERGTTETVSPLIPAVGGVIRVESDIGVAGRITDSEAESRLEDTDEERVLFENLPPGRYRVELCGDAECATVLRSWDGVEVAPLKTVDLQ